MRTCWQLVDSSIKQLQRLPLQPSDITLYLHHIFNHVILNQSQLNDEKSARSSLLGPSLYIKTKRNVFYIWFPSVL